MHTALKAAMASTLALVTAAPAMAQYQPTPQYQQDMQRYQQQRDEYQRQREAYDARRAEYDARQGSYQAAREEYQRRLYAYNRARYAYDRRHGYGAYARAYGPAPTWNESRWADYTPRANDYGANAAYTTSPPIHCDHDTTVGAGVIGALAGAILGSNVAAHGRRTEGAVLGGVVGAGIGAAVGNAHDKYKCDQRGPYFTYNETIPYREGSDYRSDRYGEYERMGCRLAPAPADSYGRDYRYVRVCPDPDGRYRIVG